MDYFKDRHEAGQKLADKLKNFYFDQNSIVLALPRGGVVVAYEIAVALNLSLNVFLVRKLGVPGHEEVAMGAISEGDICGLDEELIARLNISKRQIKEVMIKEFKELKRRLRRYRVNKLLPDLKQKTVILVDDGIATGATVKAAIKALNKLGPKNIIITIPVSSKEALAEIKPMVDQIMCLIVPEYFHGVGQYYQSFKQISDQEVINLLNFTGNLD